MAVVITRSVYPVSGSGTVALWELEECRAENGGVANEATEPSAPLLHEVHRTAEPAL